jgi:hypothetical protein
VPCIRPDLGRRVYLPAGSPHARLHVPAGQPICYHRKRPACCNDTPGQDTRRSRACVRLAAPCTGVWPAASPLTNSAAGRATRGKEAMSYQPPPDYEAGTAVRNPPGWYLDPIGLHSLRWWDGAQWARNTQPLLEPAWERPCPDPDAPASSSGGNGAVRQPDAGRHRQQGGPQAARDIRRAWAQEPFPPVRTQAQPDPGQPHDPQGSPDQQSRVPGPTSPAHHASRQRRNHTARGALTSLGALLGSSSPSARRTRAARHRQEP